MRRRAFSPDALESPALEDRVVLSHAASPVHGAAALSGLRYNMAIDMVRKDFELYAPSGKFDRLRAQLAEHTKGLPFHKADGLGMKINAILDRMQSDLGSGVPQAIQTAHRDVVDTIHRDMQSRIDDGSLHVVP